MRSPSLFRALSLTTTILAVALGGGAGCGKIFGSRLKKEECVKWRAHLHDVARTEMKTELKKCQLGDHSFDKEDELVDTCAANEGISFEQSEADCFMKADSSEGWGKCSFKKGSIFDTFSHGVEVQKKMMKELCDK
jgi:hypothetical protein